MDLESFYGWSFKWNMGLHCIENHVFLRWSCKYFIFWEGYVSQNHVRNGLFHNPKFTNAILSLGCISERISHSKLYWTIQHNVIWRQVSTFQSSFKNMRKHIMFPTQKLHIRRKIDIWYFSSSYFQLTRVIRR